MVELTYIYLPIVRGYVMSHQSEAQFQLIRKVKRLIEYMNQ